MGRGIYKYDDGSSRYGDWWAGKPIGVGLHLNSRGGVSYIGAWNGAGAGAGAGAGVGAGAGIKTDADSIARELLCKLVNEEGGRMHSTDDAILDDIKDQLKNYYDVMFEKYGYEGKGASGWESMHEYWCNDVLHYNMYSFECAIVNPVTEQEAQDLRQQRFFGDMITLAAASGANEPVPEKAEAFMASSAKQIGGSQTKTCDDWSNINDDEFVHNLMKDFYGRL